MVDPVSVPQHHCSGFPPCLRPVLVVDRHAELRPWARALSLVCLSSDGLLPKPDADDPWASRGGHGAGVDVLDCEAQGYGWISRVCQEEGGVVAARGGRAVALILGESSPEPGIRSMFSRTDNAPTGPCVMLVHLDVGSFVFVFVPGSEVHHLQLFAACPAPGAQSDVQKMDERQKRFVVRIVRTHRHHPANLLPHPFDSRFDITRSRGCFGLPLYVPQVLLER